MIWWLKYTAVIKRKYIYCRGMSMREGFCWWMNRTCFKFSSWFKLGLNLSESLERRRIYAWLRFYATIRELVIPNMHTHSHKRNMTIDKTPHFKLTVSLPDTLQAHSYSLLGPWGHIQMMTLSLPQQPTFELLSFYSQPQSCEGVGGFYFFWGGGGDRRSAPG